MTRRPAHRLLRACLPAAALLACGASSACTAPAWTLQAGVLHSRWQEHADNGRRLLAERGTLATVDAQGAATCGPLQWQALLGLADGERAYAGQSSLGQPLQTDSTVRRLRWQLTALLPLAASADPGDPPWQGGLALEQSRLWRRIASVGTVRGYPERFDQAQLSAVLQHRRRLGAGLALRARLDLGGGLPGRMLLQLPTADAARLQLGHSRHLQAELTLLAGHEGAAAAAVPGWQLSLLWRHQRTAAGPAATLWRGTLPVGGAAQPAIRQTDLGLLAGWRW